MTEGRLFDVPPVDPWTPRPHLVEAAQRLGVPFISATGPNVEAQLWALPVPCVVMVNNATETRRVQALLGAAKGFCALRGRRNFAHGKPLQGQFVFGLGVDLEAFNGAFRAYGVVMS